ncbi:MAG TPA: tRNA (adenosine(37)-N6)-dimethylallyltransferase MiaA [Arenimonas sp.]|uniref:tRNA (adenosine(37)-N6)-dimethylallyltransferase MiaA n=1 Tax=Arenimonas sp. TaxID=1872635 RepID=UPI002CD76921|nr:tRNA (adenosine(37)-N6)-dimethylallyltransferase MiaA [Arenimonas sp.]HMB57159.1 tRNA (adenosine(37)-N6)-dimethylallyltransferase MiaA [Arenimonas sp.]
MHDQRPLAIALMGPTASGKTALAVDWAQRLGSEVISVDSALVYRGLDIGAAKPNADELALAPHHLIDIRAPHEIYSAADFAADALTAMQKLAAQDRVPLLVGGTGLYFRALLEGLSAMPEADADVRAQIEREAGERGWLALHAELAQVDAAAALRIHANDPQRITRALEVHRLSGVPISHWQQASQRRPFPFRVLKLVLAPEDRTVLHERIARRFDAMLAAGFLDEVRALRGDPRLHPDLPAIRAVGYRQAWSHLAGEIDAATFREQAVAATRQLAKRQLTWLRGEHDARWFDPSTQRAGLERALVQFVTRR